MNIISQKNILKITKTSFLLMIFCLCLTAFNGFKKSIELTGGVRIEFEKTNINELKEEFPAIVQNDDFAFLEISEIDKDKVATIQEKILKYSKIQSLSYFGPSVSSYIVKSLIYSITLSLVFIFLYIFIRFDSKFAISGILTLVHDLVWVISFISLFKIKINTTIFAAIITLLGYSINDTVVIFDRIRENLFSKESISEIIEKSLKSVLRRSITTSMSTIVATFGVLFFDDQQIKLFAVVIIFGILIGTFSSIFVSTGMLFVFKLKKPKPKPPVNFMHYAT
jgi:preprotein translocase subunit SecF